jgi:hypothetical protein
MFDISRMITVYTNYVALALVLSGIRVTWLLRNHVDREYIRNLDDISRAFSVLGPSYEVLSDKGRKLLATSYILYASGILLPGVIATFRIFWK